jgi:hypothetical protein
MLPTVVDPLRYAVTSVHLKFAILKVLAKWPERHISLDEIRREIGIRIVNEGPIDHPSAEEQASRGTIWCWHVNPPLPIPPWCNGSVDSLENARTSSERRGSGSMRA